MVLLIACANVANLLLVRAEGRQQEIALRGAFGARWPRIAGVLLTESVLLGPLGGASGAVALLVKLAPEYLPRIDSIAIDPIVLLFPLSQGAGLLFGVMPMLKYAVLRGTVVLRAGGRTLSQSRETHRARYILVVLQTGLAVVLLIGSGLMTPVLTQPGCRCSVYAGCPRADASRKSALVRSLSSLVYKLRPEFLRDWTKDRQRHRHPAVVLRWAVPGGDSPIGPPSHAVMIQKHARLLDEISGSARQLGGFSPLQE